MAGGQSVWGIDLGKCALKALKLRPGGEGHLEVVAHDYIPHAKILSQPDADRDALIAAALEKFLSRNDISGDAVIVSVPGQHTLARFSKLPPVDPKKIPDLVRYEADQQIPFDMDEVVWDYQTFQVEEATEIEVGIFAMKRALVRDYLLHFGQAGISPILAQSAPLALYNAAFFDELLDDDTTVLLDIGAENTDLVVATKHNLWTRTIPLGGNNFTDALAKSFKLSFPNAENLKRTAATSKYARQAFQAMRSVFDDLAQELQRSIGFYTSTHRDAKLGRLIGLGSAFKLPGLEKYLQQKLDLNIVRPETFKMLAPGAAASAAQFVEQLPSFAVAYGLCVQGLDLAPIKTSLLPPETYRAILWQKKKPFFGAAAACLLLGSLLVWGRAMSDRRTLDAGKGQPPRQVSSVDEADRIIRNDPDGSPPAREYAGIVLNAATAFRNEYGKVAGAGQDQQKKIEQIIDLLRDRHTPLKLIDLVARSLPPPPPELATATSPEAYANAIKAGGKKLERERREEIFVESFQTDYYEDLSEEELKPMIGVPAPDEVKPAAGAKLDGYIVTVKCRTPYGPEKGENVMFIGRSLVENLRKNGREPETGFYVNRVVIEAKEKYVGGSTASPADDPRAVRPTGRGGTPPPGGGGPGGRGGGSLAPPSGGKGGGGQGGTPEYGGSPPSAAGKRHDHDPITGESTANDWVFTVKVEVVMADMPAPPPTPGAPPAPPPGT